MALHQVFNHPWTRRHDDPRQPLIARAPTIAYPAGLQQLIDLCRNRPPGVRLKAAGSHWALSPAAISDHTYIETHDPTDVHRGLERTLYDVVPQRLHPDVLEKMRNADFAAKVGTLVHIETGKRIYQLYAEFDQIDDLSDERTMAAHMARAGADHYQGPWGLATLGGAGGQTVVGAFSTGTHGGDFDRGVLPDSVRALHIVSDGGNHYWIEPTESDYGSPLIDDEEVTAFYSQGDLSGPGHQFQIVRDQAVFEAAVVGVGRFGIIYSAVLAAQPQYSLWERRRLHVWQDIRAQIKDRKGPLYTDTTTHTAEPQRFLQIVVCLTPHFGFSRNLAGVTKRWQMKWYEAHGGHAERIGDKVSDVIIDGEAVAGIYARAGRSFPYSPDENNPRLTEEPGFLDRACANASFLAGILDEAIRELEELIESHGGVILPGVAAVAAVGGGGLLLLLPWLALIVVILKELLEHFNADDRLGEHMERIKNELLDPAESDPGRRAAGLFAWQLIAYKVFELMQSDLEFGARSYAVMDRKNYLDRSCEWNVESVEVFFDALDDRTTAVVDALIAYEINQELQGKSFLGYVSLRFTGSTRATLGMQRYATTCAIEVAGLVDLSGSRELVEYATQLGLNPNFGGILHWGQRNTSTADDIERLFGTGTDPQNGGRLRQWREALARITRGGDAFSSDFTRRTGLEP